jgi:glutathione S-transferase
MRRLRRNGTGPASVPVLVCDDAVITDSGAIARWADARGSGPTLFPDDAAVRRWEEVSEQALQAGRALAMRRILGEPDALQELVPGFLRPLGPVGRFAAAVGVRRTLWKYGATRDPEDTHRERLAAALDQIADGLRGAVGSPKTLLGTFSYADIAAAQAIVYVLPPDPPPKGETRPGLRLARGSRRAFRDPVLAERYAELGAWRDALYATWRAR